MTKPSVVARDSQHTQLPWHRADSNCGDGPHHCGIQSWSEEDPEGFIVADVNSDVPDGEAAANAEFIVRACNAHEKLVESLQAIFSTKALYTWVSEKGIGDPEWKRRSAIIQQAEQALRLATGKEGA